MRRIRLDFCDFGPNFGKTDFYLYQVLKERFDVVLCDQPDFLIYSLGGHAHRLHSCVKILFSGESDQPDYRECDYSVAAIKLNDPRHLHYPNYLHYGDPAEIVKRLDRAEEILAAKTKFCSFVVSGYNPRKNSNRVDFFHKLSKYKRVESGGRILNNIGGAVPHDLDHPVDLLQGSRGKIRFLRSFKFNLAYENRSLPGYTTEKIFEAMIARSLPIYWGDPDINEHFNPKSFLNRADYRSDEELIEHIAALDQDDARYLDYLRQPYLHQDTPGPFFSKDRILDFFERVFSEPITPVARRRGQTFRGGRLAGRWNLVKRYHQYPLQPPTWNPRDP